MTAVLAFHDLGDSPGVSITHLTETRFRRHLDALRALGRPFVELKHLLNDDAQPASLHITLDDGFSSQLSAAGAVLAPVDIPATAFVVTGCVGAGAAWAVLPSFARRA